MKPYRITRFQRGIIELQDSKGSNLCWFFGNYILGFYEITRFQKIIGIKGKMSKV